MGTFDWHVHQNGHGSTHEDRSEEKKRMRDSDKRRQVIKKIRNMGEKIPGQKTLLVLTLRSGVLSPFASSHL